MFTVEYKKLPNYPDLFLDYVGDDEERFKKIRNYYNADFKSYEDILKVIEEKIRSYGTARYFDKSILAEILKKQNRVFGGNELAESNIELLKDENTFAVVTGQQVGLYTGNLYTIFKTITVIKLAAELKARFPEYNFVPVFWLESEDHDLEEANHVHIINKQNELVRIGYPAESEISQDVTKKNTKPVGCIKFDSSINGINEHLRQSLIDTDFKENLMNRLSSIYCEGNDFKTAFSHMINMLFKQHGLVIMDCSDAEIKKLLIPVFEKELNTSPKLCEEIIGTSAEIEKNYDIQVKPKVINLFFIHNENRLLIEPRENNRYALRNSKRRFERDELMNLLFENPENFSPNVVLRPICQDYLLPTAVYVGGPSEVSYFAQFKPAYEHYDITMPVIYPRASSTILESKISKFMKNFGVEFTEIFNQKVLVSKVVDKLSEIKVEEELSKAQDEFNRIFYDIRNMSSKVDKTLVSTVDNVKEKLFNNIEMIRSKLTAALARKSETTTSQIDKVTNNIYPNHTMQERVINVTYFLNKYGDEFIKKLFDETDVCIFKQHVIEV
jgi:bacillithiol biosynthesis cysteine-adding enzyme BshC